MLTLVWSRGPSGFRPSVASEGLLGRGERGAWVEEEDMEEEEDYIYYQTKPRREAPDDSDSRDGGTYHAGITRCLWSTRLTARLTGHLSLINKMAKPSHTRYLSSSK